MRLTSEDRDLKRDEFEEMTEKDRKRETDMYIGREQRSNMATREDEGIENETKTDIQKEKGMPQ